MSVREIVERIATVPECEFREIERAVEERRRRLRSGGPGPVSSEFEEAAERVMTTHAELLRRLSQ
jgi:hypothetical protein